MGITHDDGSKLALNAIGQFACLMGLNVVQLAPTACRSRCAADHSLFAVRFSACRLCICENLWLAQPQEGRAGLYYTYISTASCAVCCLGRISYTDAESTPSMHNGGYRPVSHASHGCFRLPPDSSILLKQHHRRRGSSCSRQGWLVRCQVPCDHDSLVQLPFDDYRLYIHQFAPQRAFATGREMDEASTQGKVDGLDNSISGIHVRQGRVRVAGSSRRLVRAQELKW